MEIRDWLTILIPIICNGLVIFFVQRITSSKLERRMKTFLEKKDGFHKIKSLTDEILFLYMETNYSKTSEEQTELLEKIVRTLHRIIPVRDSNLVLLSNHTKTINDIINKSNQMLDTLKAGDNVTGRQHFIELRELIVRLSNDIEKEIYSY